MWSVDVELIEDWLDSLDGVSWKQVMAALEVLRELGPQLGRPLVDTMTASRHKNLKELRPGSSGRSELRILFAFDPERRAIMLVAGDKSGNWTRWYKKNIPAADDLRDAQVTLRGVAHQHGHRLGDRPECRRYWLRAEWLLGNVLVTE